MDTRHLEKRRQTWYVRLRVPATLAPTIGKKFILKSLKTRDLREANKLKHAAIADIHNLFDAARKSLETDNPLSRIIGYAKLLSQQVKLNEIDTNTAQDELGYLIDHFTETHSQGIDPDTGHPILSNEASTSLATAFATIKNPDHCTLSSALTDYLAERGKVIRKQTLIAKENRIKSFLSWLKVDKEPKQVTKRDTGRFLTEDLNQRGLATKSVKDFLSDLSAFFNWMEGRGYTDVNPFRGLSGTILESTRGTTNPDARREWKESELVTLFEALRTKNDRKLTAFTLIGLYSGMRSNEIAETLIKNVQANYLRIPEAKNDNSVRTVPIHPIIKPMVAKLATSSNDGYLISGLLPGGTDNKRNHNIVKKFGRFKDKLGFKGTAVVYHGLRKSFIGRLHRIGCPLATIAQIVGHEAEEYSQTLAYQDGLELKQLDEAIVKVSYGTMVDDLALELALSI